MTGWLFLAMCLVAAVVVGLWRFAHWLVTRDDEPEPYEADILPFEGREKDPQHKARMVR